MGAVCGCLNTQLREQVGGVFRVTDQSGPRLRVDLTTEADGIETNNLSFEDTSDLDDLAREYIRAHGLAPKVKKRD